LRAFPWYFLEEAAKIHEQSISAANITKLALKTTEKVKTEGNI